jgi:hypothetical protein
MEDKKKSAVDADKEIVYSKSIKAGKRIYYLDVKKNRKDEMFISITESKKVVLGDSSESQVIFEKHKIFLYKEDFEKFTSGLNEMIQYIEDRQGPFVPYYNKEEEEPQASAQPDADEAVQEGEIKIDIDF